MGFKPKNNKLRDLVCEPVFQVDFSYNWVSQYHGGETWIASQAPDDEVIARAVFLWEGTGNQN